MTSNWLLPTLIAVPLLAATLPLLSSYIRKNSGWTIAAAVLGLETVLAARLASIIYTDGALTYQVGGTLLARPDTFAIGIELMADQITMLLVPLIAVVGLGVLALTRYAERRTAAFYSGYLLLNGGLMGIALTHDIFNLFVFMEITGLATYALIASGRSPESAVASLKYLIMGTAGASFYLIGVGYLYLATGTLNMSDLATILAGNGFINQPLYGNPLVATGFAFIAVGLMVKSAIFPLHTWQPSAYDTAPDDVSAYIAAVVSTLGAYALGRIMFTVLTPEFFAVNPIAAELVIVAASVSVVAGSLLAAMQYRIKRMLAYSSVSQFGLIVAAFGIAAHPSGNPTALVGGIIHLAGHGLLKAGLFLGAGLLAARFDVRQVSEYAGLAQRFPLGAGAFALLGIALIGVPPSLGFLGKWYIALGAVKSGLWPVTAVIFASTMLTLLYIARILEQIYFTPQNDVQAVADTRPIRIPDGHRPTAALAVVVVLAGLAVALGFAGGTLHDLLTPFITEVYPRG